MSTFNGIVHEFPDIAIDFFRVRSDRRPPLACFLSHVHSDHLAGLETHRSPFVYCSAATREILLRLERYPCRMNYAQGILEAQKQTYKHLQNRLKSIPLETPTELELAPGKAIQVTMLDANHCTGAVMFLIEGDGKAILYTGDIRSEPWWVNSIARNPSMIKYSFGLESLNCIYLDTSFLSDCQLQTKAEGLRDLLDQVSKYPEDTVFCLQAWTYGYEEVWIALSKALNSKVHVDKYKMGVYKSLVAKSPNDRFGPQFHFAKEAPYLVGFSCGNNQYEGCLTRDENVRIHSCEKGTPCSVMQNKPIVWIQPIVAHLPDGNDIAEVGIGGGGGDLEREPTFEQVEPEDIEILVQMISEKLTIPSEVKSRMQTMLEKHLKTGRSLPLDMDISEFSDGNAVNGAKETTLGKALESIAKKAQEVSNEQLSGLAPAVKSLPNQIRFAYARHSSYPELKHLVEMLKPKDVWPCTVDELSWFRKGIKMRDLFGKYCSGDTFRHDIQMNELLKKHLAKCQELRKGLNGKDGQRTASSAEHYQSSPLRLSSTDPPDLEDHQDLPGKRTPTKDKVVTATDVILISSSESSPVASTLSPTSQPRKRSYDTFREENQSQKLDDTMGEDPDVQGDSQASSLSARAYETRLRAFRAMDEDLGSVAWSSISLISTTNHHTTSDEELGSK